jgi:hypothetical protein
MGSGMRREWRRHTAAAKNHADGVGMAHGECNHLRPDAGFVDTERRHGVSIRDILLDIVFDGPRCGVAQRKCDLHAYGHD